MVAPETWQDTLHLLCDEHYAVRSDYTHALAHFIQSELSDRSTSITTNRMGYSIPFSEDATPHQPSLHSDVYNDETARFLHAMHVYAFVLATATSLQPSVSAPDHLDFEPLPVMSNVTLNVVPPTPIDTPTQTPSQTPLAGLDFNLVQSTASISINLQTRRQSSAKALQFQLPSKWSASQVPVASASDYYNLLNLLTVEHEYMRSQAAVCGIPFLIALDSFLHQVDDIRIINGHVLCLREVLARTWLKVGNIWKCKELIEMSELAISSIPGSTHLPSVDSQSADEDAFFPSIEQAPVRTVDGDWSGVNASVALDALLSDSHFIDTLGLDRGELEERLRSTWTPQSSWIESMELRLSQDPLRGDGSSTRLRLSPGLMHIENMSLQSLSRSTRGIGVSDLRDALEGRGSMSNPNLAKPPSVSTLDHTSANHGNLMHRLAPVRSQPDKPKIRGDTREVREVLNKLRIGKSIGAHNAMLKASFPSLQRPEARSSTFIPPYKT